METLASAFTNQRCWQFIVGCACVAWIGAFTFLIFKGWQDFGPEGRYFTENKCAQSLDIAAQASTVEQAKTLTISALAACEKTHDAPEGAIWFQNLAAQKQALKQVSPTASAQQRYFVLKQFKESLNEANVR